MKMGNVQPSGKRRGFTLVEMLVVVFIGTVIFTLVAGGMISTAKTSRKHLNHTARSMTCRLILEQMTRDIESAFAYPDPQTGMIVFQGENQELGQGMGDKLTFLRPKLDAPVPIELERVVYEGKEFPAGDSTQQTVFFTRSVGGTVNREAKIGLPEKYTHTRLNLQYRADGDASQWVDQWNGAQQGIPGKVKIELESIDERFDSPVRYETVVKIQSASIPGATP